MLEEDPTFSVRLDEETGQTVIGGMGELHLDILVTRMKREFKVDANVGAPQVAYRETIRRKVDKVDFTHKKQTGGSGQFAKVQVAFEPIPQTEDSEIYEFVDAVTGGRVPREYIPSVDQGIQAAMENGILAEDTRWLALRPPSSTAPTTMSTPRRWHSRSPARVSSAKASSRQIRFSLEPMMDVEVRTPEEYMGDVIGDLNSRRGMIQSMEDATGIKIVRAQVPLSEMFGYVGVLRSKTQGRAVYTMQFATYAEVPRNVSEEIIKKTRGE